MGIFNQALLAKQSWRIMNNPDSIVSQILQFKYYRRSTFLEAKLGSRPSFIWRSLLDGRKLLEKGLRWSVGDGRDIQVWTQRWIPIEPSFKVTTFGQNGYIQTVDQLISYGTWNIQLLRQTFLPHEVDAIVSIPINQHGSRDRQIWHYKKNGVYTVKSGYKMAYAEILSLKASTEGHTTSTANRKAWTFLWSINLPPKVKAFLWRLATDSLPLGSNLLKRKITDGKCKICNREIENWHHCLFDCSWIRGLWTIDCEFRMITSKPHLSFLDVCYDLFSNPIQKADLFLMMLWFVWIGRNNSTFNDDRPSSRRIFYQAKSFLDEHQSLQQVLRMEDFSGPLPDRWLKPPRNTLKVNVDAGKRGDLGATGIVIRDEYGSLIAAFSIFIGVVASVEFAELKSILLGAKEAARIWSGAIIVESDSANCISRFESEEDDLLPLGCMVKQVKEMKRLFKSCNFRYVKRHCNLVADELARFGFNLPNHVSGFQNWGTNPPPSVISLLLADAI